MKVFSKITEFSQVDSCTMSAAPEQESLLAGDLEAGDGGSKMDAVFANFDKDGNGTISPSELRAAMAEVCLRNERWGGVGMGVG